MESFENACAEIEKAAAERERVLKAVLKAVGKIKKAAGSGEIAALRKAEDEEALAIDAWKRLTETSPSARTDFESALESTYEDEVLQAAREAGLRVDRLHGHAIVASRILRVLPDRLAVLIDSRKTTRLRPSLLVRELSTKRADKPRFAPKVLVEQTRKAYLFLAGAEGDGRPKPLRDIWEALTLLPGSRKEYDLADFVRDIYFLQRSDYRQSKDGYRVEFIAPSTAASHGGGFPYYDASGERHDYYAIAFRRVSA